MFVWLKNAVEQYDQIEDVGDKMTLGVAYSLMFGLIVSLCIPIVCVVWQALH